MISRFVPVGSRWRCCSAGGAVVRVENVFAPGIRIAGVRVARREERWHRARGFWFWFGSKRWC